MYETLRKKSACLFNMSAARVGGKRPAAGELPRINLKVKGLEDGRLLMFRTKKRDRLQKLMTIYSAWVSVDFNDNRFFFNGHEISAEDTPDALGMADEDEIHALRCLCGRVRPGVVTHNDIKKLEADESPQKLNLRVVDMDGSEASFIIRKETQLKKLMNAHCNRYSFDIAGCWFLYKGHRLKAHQTPDELRFLAASVFPFISFCTFKASIVVFQMCSTGDSNIFRYCS